MRVDLAKTGLVRTGDLVRINLRLRRGADYGRITVWARSGDDDFSPYINEERILAQSDDKPQFLTPLAFRLTGHRAQTRFEFVSETDQEFKLVQDVDSLSELRVRARIKSYGKTATSIGRYLRNALRAFRRTPKPPQRSNI